MVKRGTTDHERVQAMYRMHLEGKSMTEIGAAFNATRQTASSLLSYHGLLRRKEKPEIAGKKFARLTAIAQERMPEGRLKWRCVCDCGTTVFVYGSHLVKGASRSCGCLKGETTTARNKATAKHGMWRSNEFAIWGKMLSRCYLKASKSYPRYGGRGILVCDRWRTDFAAFFADMGPRPSLDHSLERVDNNRGYEPGNVVWATRIEQQNNRRDNVRVTVNGETMTATQLARKHGLNPDMVLRRIKAGKQGAALVSPSRRPPKGEQ